MKTEALLRALAADAARPVVDIRLAIAVALAIGVALSLTLFGLVFRPRPDIGMAIHAHSFLLKLALMAILTLTTTGLLPVVARPLPPFGLARLMIAPLMLAVAVVVELNSFSPSDWAARALGRNALHCLGSIPLLSLPPAGCLFFALRRGAPASASLAGAVAALVSAAIGASLYALTCPDDSPLFVALWYSLAIGSITWLGAVVGRRWLRW
jgi:hypothetical protein